MQRRLLRTLLLAVGLALLWQACLSYTRSQAGQSQQRLQGVQLVELDRQLNQFSFIPKLLASDVEIRQALLAGDDASLLAANRRLSRTQQDSGLDFAFLLDRQGVTLASSNWADPVSFVGIDYSFRPYFQNAISGRGATFFAVGVTTGVPGYFIAEPVTDNSGLVGVVVAKVALGVLVDGWAQLPYESVVSDDFGTIILSTREDLLYSPTEPVSAAQVVQLLRERRYELQAPLLEPVDGEPDKRLLSHAGQSTVYLSYASSLSTEPWQLISLIPQRSVQKRALQLFAALLAALLIAYLFLRLFQQQQQLVAAEKRNSQELEEQVLHRTRELEAAQKRLISEANFAMLGRMSAAINHEINQPLASLRLNLASLRTMMETPDADRGEIEQIVVDSDRTTKRIGRVISSLRSIARNSNAHFETVDMQKLLEEVRQTILRERPTLSAHVVFEQGTVPVPVSGDEVLIQQTLLNLLYNAFDAVLKQESPRIQVVLQIQAGSAQTPSDSRAANGWAVVSVSDNGSGVKPTLQESLFEPFSTSRQHSDGLGLGLTIARQIAEDHGGELQYQALAEGSCFTLRLPLQQPVPSTDSSAA
ncbi:sensor histidine kinase [Granulosicoccus sp. 3-233]|uniref:sensor histidine kinase n=1 Tax=Granulosicoccus sp. 3-233 TaxID=3417969 RepID=UPI003D33DA40